MPVLARYKITFEISQEKNNNCLFDYSKTFVGLKLNVYELMSYRKHPKREK